MQPLPNPMPILTGMQVRLRPMVAGDAAEFSKIVPLDTFRYFVSSVPTEETPDGFAPYVSYVLGTPSIRGFTAEWIQTGAVIGSSCYLDIRPEDGHVEIGMTFYAPEFRRSRVNPECKLLLLTHAFESLGCEKVTLKSDARNEISRRAMEKLGAEYEGTLRRHRFNAFGEFRDTAFYGILKEEWPSVKDGLLNRLSVFTDEA